MKHDVSKRIVATIAHTPIGNLSRCLITALSAVFSVSMTSGQQLPKALLLTGNGNMPELQENYPPWVHEFQNDQVIEILDGIVDIDSTAELSDLNAENLTQYDVLISNSLFLAPDADGLDAIRDFVANGKSFLTLHCGILSFLNWEKYEEFIGGIFIGGPSAEPKTFRVHTANHEFWGYPYSFRASRPHPISLSVGDFDITDELYFFQPSTPDIDVIARAENHPVMWWRPFKRGKIMSLTLGHDATAKSNPGYQELLKNGVRWLTGYPLIYQMAIPPISNRTLQYERFLTSPTASILAGGGVSVHRIENPSTLFKLGKRNGEHLDLALDGDTGTARFTVAIQNEKGLVTEKEMVLQVVEDGTGNIAAYYGNSIDGSAAENESGLLGLRNIIDGDLTTRWSSKPGAEASLTLDLRKTYPLTKINILWEASYAAAYNIMLSADGKNWYSGHQTTIGSGALETIVMPRPMQARFIRLDMKQRATGKVGYSIYELEVFQ
ncbi:F5/8 type C domain-containing protein [Parapedobacter luteus]|uniref:F5/8 type C domain-containing protein n=1 Tax=Parapedobacter luteus TaxID=623280 RepID=A0A1T5BCK5_9SPHI|nr:ThuA domain-containing protein [Parapedobacter luteus]SKB44797.1 F5/8 type C domain-containing protein [Parapedobacter luteus]